ncbi:hypothetical protein C8F01DRAFT_1243551 [Mycena amicta]|nr:hypothetical protein C8F01DRAFT_1243551 [Mycena amicta]
MSVAATVRRLQSRAKLVRQLVLIANPTNEPPSTYLDALATAAHRAADSLLCSSILAGHASESDDFADMAVWLGNDRSYGKGNEQSVLAALQLGLETGTVCIVSAF